MTWFSNFFNVAGIAQRIEDLNKKVLQVALQQASDHSLLEHTAQKIERILQTMATQAELEQAVNNVVTQLNDTVGPLVTKLASDVDAEIKALKGQIAAGSVDPTASIAKLSDVSAQLSQLGDSLTAVDSAAVAAGTPIPVPAP